MKAKDARTGETHETYLNKKIGKRRVMGKMMFGKAMMKARSMPMRK